MKNYFIHYKNESCYMRSLNGQIRITLRRLFLNKVCIIIIRDNVLTMNLFLHVVCMLIIQIWMQIG